MVEEGGRREDVKLVEASGGVRKEKSKIVWRFLNSCVMVVLGCHVPGLGCRVICRETHSMTGNRSFKY